MTSTVPVPAALLDRLRARSSSAVDSPVTHVEHIAARHGRPVPWPSWVSPDLIAVLSARGIPAPWEHQAAAASLAWDGMPVVIATGTASGKSLAYQMPTLTRLLTDPRARTPAT